MRERCTEKTSFGQRYCGSKWEYVTTVEEAQKKVGVGDQGDGVV